MPPPTRRPPPVLSRTGVSAKIPVVRRGCRTRNVAQARGRRRRRRLRAVGLAVADLHVLHVAAQHRRGHPGALQRRPPLRATVGDRLTLENAGPVAVGTMSAITPVLSGKGELLETDVPRTFYIAKGTRLYIAATGVNRVKLSRSARSREARSPSLGTPGQDRPADFWRARASPAVAARQPVDPAVQALIESRKVSR